MSLKPGTNEYEKKIAFMRADLENNMRYSKIEMAAREIFKNQGRDFDKEFKEFQERKNRT